MKVYGHLLIDYGPENKFSENKYEEIMNNKSLSATQKFSKLSNAAVEYSCVAKGTLELKLADITSQAIGDYMLADIGEINVLVSKKDKKGNNTGSSGMPTGLHIYLKPKFINPIDVIQQNTRKMLTLAIKMQKKIIKKPPTKEDLAFKGSDSTFGIFLGPDDIRFKLNIIDQKKSIFSLKCVITTKSFSDFNLDCDFDGSLVQIIKEGVKVIVKYAKKGIAAVKKAYDDVITFGVSVKDSAVEIYNKMEKQAVTLWKNAKLAAELLVAQAKSEIKKLKKNIEIFGKQLKKSWQYVQNYIMQGGEYLKHHYQMIVLKIEQEFRRIGDQIYTATEVFMKHNYIRWNGQIDFAKLEEAKQDLIRRQVEETLLKMNIINKVVAQDEVNVNNFKLKTQNKNLIRGEKEIERNRKLLEEL